MATYDLTSSTPSKIQTGDIINCPYSGTYKSITLPAGEYRLEVWGASGASIRSTSIGGKGGYSYGTLILSQSTTLYLYSGQQGYQTYTAYSFNGGGTGETDSVGASGTGGGASDISLYGGNWDSTNHLYSRIIVAGGGGGGSYGGTWGTSYDSAGGAGGGVSGINGTNAGGESSRGYGYGASQTGVGANRWSSAQYTPSFGKGGGNGSNGGGDCIQGGGGGGGWYGGGAGNYNGGGGGGGSGYIYTSSTASNYPSGCLLDSSYYLTNASTTAGNLSFLSPSGSSETGHEGDGYCRITVIKAGASATLYIKINGKWEKPY